MDIGKNLYLAGFEINVRPLARGTLKSPRATSLAQRASQ